MKKILFVMIVVGLSSCNKDDDGGTSASQGCKQNSTTNIRSINFFDFRIGSPYYNQVVANFKFTQTTSTYTGSVSCPTMDCKTTLLLQNSTAKTITFDYSINFTLNLINWNYQGVATIPAGGSVDVGQINTNCGSISLGAILLQSKSISYN